MAAEPGTDTGPENGQQEDAAKKSKQQKNKDRKQKKKLNKQQRRQEQKNKPAQPSASKTVDEEIVIEYVTAPVDLDALRPDTGRPGTADDYEYGGGGGLGLGATPGLGMSSGLGFSDTPAVGARSELDPDELGLYQPKKDPLEDLRRVIEKFTTLESTDTGSDEDMGEEEEGGAEEPRAKPAEEKKASTSDTDSDDEEGGKDKASKKKQKMLNRLKIAELKQLCAKPEVVEVWDVTAQDPQLLVFLKGYRNTVPVPRHWSQKRKYLQGKRGIEKPAFKLPDFIEATGISQIRETYLEKEEAKKLKQKQRERMQPKIGRMNIDYQILHDAFFKHQTKPKLSILGEVYYEGKEFEARVENVKPGILSSDLRNALGMTDGTPPPWLINMQRYGPPPSYPNLKVPGLNAPIPPGASFGYHPGGWGKPPVDEDGNPLYGDVFGQYTDGNDTDDELDKSAKWGDMEEEEEEEESEEEEEDDDEDGLTEEQLNEGIESGMASGMVSGMASGIASSLPSGIETPSEINLRKATDSTEPRQLYTVLEQKAVPVGQAGIMGGDHIYVIPGADKGRAEKRVGDRKRQEAMRGMAVNDVEVTLNPDELEGLSQEEIARLYEARASEIRDQNRPEDFRDMVAQHSAAQKRKLQQKTDQKSKKQKDSFKF